jgi:hypothetical protein
VGHVQGGTRPLTEGLRKEEARRHLPGRWKERSLPGEETKVTFTLREHGASQPQQVQELMKGGGTERRNREQEEARPSDRPSPAF